MWWLLLGGLLTVAVVSVIIYKSISWESIEETAKDKHILGDLIIDSVNRSTNTIKLSSLENEEELEITGTDIEDYIEEGDIIYVY